MKILETALGRGHFLNIAAQAEASDATFFDALVDLVELKHLRLIERHRADEERHASILRECVLANGVEPYPVPAHLQYFETLVDSTHGFMRDLSNTENGIMKAYALLQVAEERAKEQYEYIEPLIRPHDSMAADALVIIARDEAKHIKYCQVLSNYYAPDPKTLSAFTNYYRWIEDGVFRDFAKLCL